VTSKSPQKIIHKGALAKARLFVGEADVEREAYTTDLGEVAVVSIADHEKPRPNEDSAAIIPVNNQCLVLIVADGVGGMAGARRASNLTVRTIRKHIATIDEASGSHLRTAILDGIEAANQAVLNLGNGSASTLALAELGPGYVRTYHVGDSILMMCGQRGVLKFLTTPHSPVGFAMEAGLINESEALQHAELNLIFNVIGSADMRIEIGSELPIAMRDSLLLASDGLTDNVMQDEIIGSIRTGPVDAALSAIMALAQSRMTEEKPGQPSKPDDCTAILFRPKASRRKSPARPAA
jgi:serine/threonine protein phosphatase PrpC